MADCIHVGLRGDGGLDFGDAAPVCLECGAAPAGTKRVNFVDYEQHERWWHHFLPTLSYFGKTVRDTISFDAPLCAAHLKRAKRIAFHAHALFIAIVVVIALLHDELKPDKPLGFVVGVALIFTYWLWHRKDRGGLRCTVHWEADGRLRITTGFDVVNGP